MKVYLVMSLLMLVNLAIFRQGGALSEADDYYSSVTLTLGNLGFSRSKCFVQYLDTKEARDRHGDSAVPLQCAGNHHIGDNITYGLMSDKPDQYFKQGIEVA